MAVQWLILCLPTTQGMQVLYLPGQRAKIPQASWPKTQNRNRSDFVKNAIKTLKMAHIKKKKNLKKMTTVMRLPNNESFLNHKFCTVYSQTFTVPRCQIGQHWGHSLKMPSCYICSSTGYSLCIYYLKAY